MVTKRLRRFFTQWLEIPTAVKRLEQQSQRDYNSLRRMFITNIERILRAMEKETTDILDRIDAVSTDLAGDLQKLIDLAAAKGSLTEAEVRAALAPRVTFLEQLAHVADDPIPPPIPEPIPET